jgi:hypothetical protein
MTAPEFDALVEKAARDWLANYHGSIDATALLLAFKAGNRAALTAAGVEDLLAEVERLDSVEFVHRGCQMIHDNDVQGVLDERDEALAEVDRLRLGALHAAQQLRWAVDKRVEALTERDALAAQVEETWPQWGTRRVGGIVQEVHARGGMTAEEVARNARASITGLPVDTVTRRVTAWKVVAPAPAQSDPDATNGAPRRQRISEEGK